MKIAVKSQNINIVDMLKVQIFLCIFNFATTVTMTNHTYRMFFVIVF